MIDIVNLYQDAYKEYTNKDITYYENFLEYCGRLNNAKLSVFNKVLGFAQKPNATEIGTYEYWSKRKRKPISGTGICMVSKVNMGVYYYDVSDTKSIGENSEPSNENRLKASNEINSILENDIEVLLENLLTINSLYKHYNKQNVDIFIKNSAKKVLYAENHISDKVVFDKEFYNDIKSNGRVITEWIMPIVMVVAEKVNNIIEKEHEKHERDTGIEISNDNGNDTSKFERGWNEGDSVHKEELSGENRNNAANRGTVANSKTETGKGEELQKGSDEPTRTYRKEEYGRLSNGVTVVDRRDSLSAVDDLIENNSVHIPQYMKSDLDLPYDLRTNGNGRFLCKSSDELKGSKVLGRFQNYKETSVACSFWDRMSDVNKSEYLKMEPEEMQEKFEKDFVEMYREKVKLECETEIYQFIIGNSINENRMISSEEAALMFLCKAIIGTSFAAEHEYLYDIMKSNISFEMKKDFMKKYAELVLQGVNSWTNGKAKDVNENEMVFAVYPYLITGNSLEHGPVDVRINYNSITYAAEMIVNSKSFHVEDLSSEIIKKNPIDKELLVYCEKFIEENNIEKNVIKDRPIRYSKDSAFDDKFKNKVLEMPWYKKYAVRGIIQKYEAEPNYDARVKEIEKEIGHYQEVYPVKQGYEGFCGVISDENGISAVYKEKDTFRKSTMEWIYYDKNIMEMYRAGSFITPKDRGERTAYVEKSLDLLLQKKEYASIKEVYKDTVMRYERNDECIPDREAAVLSLSRIICDREHLRYRPYLKEIFMCKELEFDKKTEVISDIINKYMWKYCGGSFHGMISRTDEHRAEIVPFANMFGGDYDNKLSTYYLNRTYLSYPAITKILESIVTRDDFELLSDDRYERLPEGFETYFYSFMQENNLECKYIKRDNPNDVLTDKKDTYEQMDLLSYMCNSKNSKKKTR